MIFRTPRFWYADGKAERTAGLLLSPLGMLYGFLVRKRFGLHHPVPLSRPVICVGNLTAGGTGKTPVALSLAQLLKDHGHNPHYLTRGYGGSERGPLQVAPTRDTAADVGDEALLLVENAPTWVSANRPIGAQMAIDSGASVVVMDDGFQNPTLYKNFALLVVDGGAGFGNLHVFPAGPMREELVHGLSRAHAVVIIGEDKTGAERLIKKYTDIPVLHARLVPEEKNPDVTKGAIYAFAGIGRPEKFKETLLQAGAQLDGFGSYPDHFAYIREDLQELIKDAEKKNAMIVTTAKDYVRLPAAIKAKVKIFRVRLVWDDPEHISTLLDNAVNTA